MTQAKKENRKKRVWACAGQPLLQRASSLPDPALLHQAAFVPPGYGSLLFAHLYENNTCPLSFPGSVFSAFRGWVRDSLQLPLQGPLPVQGQSLKVHPGSRVLMDVGARLDTVQSPMAAQWSCTRSSCSWVLGADVSAAAQLRLASTKQACHPCLSHLSNAVLMWGELHTLPVKSARSPAAELPPQAGKSTLGPWGERLAGSSFTQPWPDAQGSRRISSTCRVAGMQAPASLLLRRWSW